MLGAGATPTTPAMPAIAAAMGVVVAPAVAANPGVTKATVHVIFRYSVHCFVVAGSVRTCGNTWTRGGLKPVPTPYFQRRALALIFS